MIFENIWLRLLSTALIASKISGEWMQNWQSVPSALWSLSRSDSTLFNTGTHSSSDGGSILPGTQRMPQTFSGFLAGGRTSNGFDLESFTKNAAIETNKQQHALASQLNLAALIDQPQPPSTAHLLSESTMPRQLLLQNRGFNGIMPSAWMPSLPSSVFQMAFNEAMPSTFLQRSSRPTSFSPIFFDGARNGIGSGGENFEDISFGDGRLIESVGFANSRGNSLPPTHFRSSTNNDGQTPFAVLPFSRTFPSDFQSSNFDSNQRSAFGLVETPNEQLFERGMQRARPVGGVTISQRPLTDADKIGRVTNSMPWFPETPTFSRIASFTSNARMHKDDLLQESNIDEDDSRNDIRTSA